MPKDLHTFIAQEERNRPGSVIREKNRIDCNQYETIAYLKHLDLRNEAKMVLFENVPALNGEPSRFPLFYNPWVTRQFVADSLDMGDLKSPMDLSLEVARRELKRGSVEVIAPEKAPVKETVLRGDKADLRVLPIPMHQKDDVGPYLTMACAMKGFNADFYDITFTKNRYYEPRRMSFSAHKHHHLEAIATEYEEHNERAPVIVILGHHPAFFLSTCCMTPYGNDDYLTASAFLGEPLRLTPSTTWGEKFLVPADAEVIIEGEIPPGVRDSQNPFGEILGYYQVEMKVPVIEVTAITARKDAIVEDFWPGHMDHWNLGSIPKEGSVYNVIRKNIPGVRAVHLPPSGAGRCICYISIKKEFENEPNKAGMQAFVEMPNLKLAVIVDDDVDVFNEREVMWAVATRVHWDKDIEIIREVQSFRGWLGDAVAIIDATVPLSGGYPKRNEVHPEAFARVAKFFK
ncbi:MAG TPA: UbiD family decarboxylase [candidate division Zixibacteria bacterium]|nr:UbiD family decarboxylase [candidate division Zixibacteria bacterium]